MTAGDERRRMSATPPASPQPAFAAASPAAAPRVTADRVSPSAWNSSQPSAVDRDGSPAQQVRPPHAAGASGFGSAQRGRAEPYSQPNGVLNDGDAMVDWPGAAAHASGSRSPPGTSSPVAVPVLAQDPVSGQHSTTARRWRLYRVLRGQNLGLCTVDIVYEQVLLVHLNFKSQTVTWCS